jgi:hypothetical protein
MFEPHRDGYLVFGERGGALFSLQERDAYVAAHRKAKPGWKAFPIVVAAILGVALVEFVGLGAMLQMWPALRSSPDAVATAVAAIALTLPVALIGGLAYPTLMLVWRLRREADRRPPLAPPRERAPWKRKLPNWIAFLGVVGLCAALAAGRITPTWPWVLAGCGVIALVCYVVARPSGR